MVGVLLLLLLGITGSLGRDCNCEPCKYVPEGPKKGEWDLLFPNSTSCPYPDGKFGCLYTKYGSTETVCFCDRGGKLLPGDILYEVCSIVALVALSSTDTLDANGCQGPICPPGTIGPGGCCPEQGWFCCPNGLNCARHS